MIRALVNRPSGTHKLMVCRPRRLSAAPYLFDRLVADVQVPVILFRDMPRDSEQRQLSTKCRVLQYCRNHALSMTLS